MGSSRKIGENIMKNINIRPIKTQQFIKTTFNCPIELRDRLEQIINDNPQYSTEEIIYKILDNGLRKEGY